VRTSCVICWAAGGVFGIGPSYPLGWEGGNWASRPLGSEGTALDGRATLGVGHHGGQWACWTMGGAGVW